MEIFVKTEENASVCSSCLSKDRRLFPLKGNSDLYVFLMGQHGPFVVPEHVFVCWECEAMLRKLRRFQYKVQQAQQVLQMVCDQYNQPKTLSTLSKCKLTNTDYLHNPDQYDYDFNEGQFMENDLQYKIYDPSEILQPIKENTFQLVENLVKEILPNEILPKEVLTKDIKVEEDYDQDFNYEPDNDLIIEPPKTKKKKKLAKKGENYYQKYTRYAKIAKNRHLDLDNINSCFDEYVLTEQDMENAGKLAKKSKCPSRLRYAHCGDCNKSYKTSLDLKRHLTFYHILKEKSKGPIKCLECDLKCEDKNQLLAHWASHNLVMRCRVCGDTILPSQGWHLKEHMKKHERVLTCKVCPPDVKKEYRSLKDYGYHYQEIHKQSICGYCGERFSKRGNSKSALLRHIRATHLPPYCYKCRKPFENFHKLSRHQYTCHPHDEQTKPEQSYCVECDKYFSSALRYKLHLAKTVTHNPSLANRKVIVPCPECGKQFSRKTYMNNHYKLYHQKQTRFYCELCDKYLSNSWAMKQHIRGVHQKIRQPKTKVCDLCGRAFGTNAILAKHRRTHTGERPYKCKLCGAAFTQSSPLVSHLRTQHKVYK